VGSNLSPAHALPGDVKEEISEMIDDGTGIFLHCLSWKPRC